MRDPLTGLLEFINLQVAQFSMAQLAKLVPILDAAELELTRALGNWKILGKGDERFTPQVYRTAVLQIRQALTHIRGPMVESINSVLRHKGKLAAELSTQHIRQEVSTLSHMFEGTIRPVSLEAATVLAEGKKAVWKRFETSSKRYGGAVGEDIQRQLAIGVVKGETIDQLTTRITQIKITTSQAASVKAENISEALFTKYRHNAERLTVTETVNAYNEFAVQGLNELNKDDPGYLKRWDAAVDGRTCPNCKEYDGIVVGTKERFRGDIDHPPLHPRCRCAIVAWRKEWKDR